MYVSCDSSIYTCSVHSVLFKFVLHSLSPENRDSSFIERQWGILVLSYTKGTFSNQTSLNRLLGSSSYATESFYACTAAPQKEAKAFWYYPQRMLWICIAYFFTQIKWNYDTFKGVPYLYKFVHSSWLFGHLAHDISESRISSILFMPKCLVMKYLKIWPSIFPERVNYIVRAFWRLHELIIM